MTNEMNGLDNLFKQLVEQYLHRYMDERCVRENYKGMPGILISVFLI